MSTLRKRNISFFVKFARAAILPERSPQFLPHLIDDFSYSVTLGIFSDYVLRNHIKVNHVSTGVLSFYTLLLLINYHHQSITDYCLQSLACLLFVGAEAKVGKLFNNSCVNWRDAKNIHI